MINGKNLLAVLVALSLGWAYVETHRTPGARNSGAHTVQVWEADIASVREILYSEGEKRFWITPEVLEHEDEPYLWVRAKAPAKAPNRGSRGNRGDRGDRGDRNKQSGGQAGEPLQESEYKGNQLAQSTFERFRRLMAKRSLGPSDKLDLKVYGLDGDPPSLTLFFSGDREPWQLQLGRKTYGNGLRYANVLKDGQVYLVRGNIADNFTRSAKRFFDSRILPFAAGTAARIEIDRAGKTQSLWHVVDQGVRGRGKYWAREKDGADAVDAMTAVVTQLSRLRAESYLPKGEKRSLGAELEVRLFKDSDSGVPAWLRIYPGGGDAAVAVSSLTRQAVRVNSKVTKKLLELVIAMESAD